MSEKEMIYSLPTIYDYCIATKNMIKYKQPTDERIFAMTNDIITAPRKQTPFIFGAVCIVFCFLFFIVDCVLPYTCNIFGIPDNFMTVFTPQFEIVARIITGVAFLIVIVALFAGKSNTLLYVSLLILSSGYLLLWICQISNNLTGLKNLDFSAGISYVYSAVISTSVNLLIVIGILVFALWVVFASKKKLLRIWFIPALAFVFPFATTFSKTALRVASLLQYGVPSSVVYYFLSSDLNQTLLVLALALCALFTCIKLKKNITV